MSVTSRSASVASSLDQGKKETAQPFGYGHPQDRSAFPSNISAILRDQCAHRKRLAAPDREDGHLRTMGVAAFYDVNWEARDGQGRAGSLGWLGRCEGEVSLVVGVAL